MATEILDLRRMDQRSTHYRHPLWLTSAAIEKEADDKAAILFSFPPEQCKAAVIHVVAAEIVTPFAGGTITLDVGKHTIPTEQSKTGDTAAIVNYQGYIVNTDITHGTAGIYFPGTSDFVTQLAAGAMGGSLTRMIPSASNVPCLSVQLASSAQITAGEARIHALVSFIR